MSVVTRIQEQVLYWDSHGVPIIDWNGNVYVQRYDDNYITKSFYKVTGELVNLLRSKEPCQSRKREGVAIITIEHDPWD